MKMHANFRHVYYLYVQYILMANNFFSELTLPPKCSLYKIPPCGIIVMLGSTPAGL